MSDKATRKSWIYSAAAHGLVAVVSLLSFYAKPFTSPPMDSVTVELISADQLPSVMKGIKDGDKTEKKALVEKVAEVKPMEDAVGKVEKKTIVTDAAPKEQPKPKEVEKKPDPPAEVEKKAEAPKAEKKSEPKPEPKIDPIAEALKQESKKPQPKQETKAAPAPPAKPRERAMTMNQIAELLDKRDPTRTAATGETLNQKAALGKSTGSAVNNSATWGSMFEQQVERCWNRPFGAEQRQPMVSITVRLGRDGVLQAAPKLEQPSTDPTIRMYQETAVRAVIQCQPYRLPPTMYEGDFGWNFFTADFVEKGRG